jgi:hypothetical protein
VRVQNLNVYWSPVAVNDHGKHSHSLNSIPGYPVWIGYRYGAKQPWRGDLWAYVVHAIAVGHLMTLPTGGNCIMRANADGR